MAIQKGFRSKAENQQFSNYVSRLIALPNDPQLKTCREKEQLLVQLFKLNSSKANTLLLYFKTLLFNSAYPGSKNIYRLCISGLHEFHEKIARLPKKELAILEQSGLPGTLMHGVYSFTLLNWLLDEKLIKAELLSFDEDALHPRLVFRNNLMEAEFELLSHENNSHLDWIRNSFGCADFGLLPELLKQVKLLTESESEKDQILESLRPIVQFVSGRSDFRLSFETKTFLHPDGLLKKVDISAILESALPPPQKLRSWQKKEIIRSARLCLLYLNRETDPVTNCAEDGIEYYRLERGFSLAFFSQKPERRLPFESYIGFMMFKNGLPLAYGGAWIFGRKSLLGINIFESYRGGESAFLFSQLLRAYRQRFGASSIEVEAYQFGLDNPEGINSGAFWFYYRFGFRPAEARLRTLAAREFKKIKASKSYKSSKSTLRAFTASNMVLTFERQEDVPDTTAFSSYISESINRYFNSDRKDFRSKAIEKLNEELGLSYKTLKRTEKAGYDKLLPFVALCIEFKSMPESDRVKLRELILEKGRSEFRFTELCAAFPFSKYLKKSI